MIIWKFSELQALDLGRGANPKGYMVEEIWQELAKAKYLLWEHESSKRSWELQTLKYVSLLLLHSLCFLAYILKSTYSFSILIINQRCL